MAYASVLDDRGVIALSGADARTFLQGLITNDMAGCAEEHALYAALLTPQGKILFDFFIVAEGPDGFLIDCAKARAEDLVKRLKLYRLRAKVEIASRPELAVAAAWGDDATGIRVAGRAVADPRHPALGFRLIGSPEALAAALNATAAGDYHAHRLSLGVPDSADLPPDQVFALDAGLEELHGLSFKKGCYVGQEVTARMKHRASARRRFLIAEAAGPVPPPRTAIEAGGREIGTLATGKGGRALALIRLDRLAEAEEKRASITVAGETLRLRKPDWLRL